MPCESCSHTDRCGHSGTTSSDGGQPIRACDLITCYSHRQYQHSSWTAESSVGYAEKKMLAITLRRGSRYVRNLLEADFSLAYHNFAGWCVKRQAPHRLVQLRDSQDYQPMLK